MCYLCDEYGDPNVGNGLWYLNPLNHARNMYKLRMPGGAVATTGTSELEERAGDIEELLQLIEKGEPEEYERKIKQVGDTRKQRGRENQVVPLEEADKILELCSPIGLMSCSCRRRERGIDERNEHEYTCMGMGAGMLKWERWPENYKGGVKFLNIDEAKEWNHEMDRRGFVHLVMLFGAPFIGGFCQCDYPDCSAIRRVLDFGVSGVTLKSHSVAIVDYDLCNGCGICAQRCQWGVLKFEVTTEKPNIDQFMCYGCGLCQTGCPRGAIKLFDRKSLPALAEVW